MAKTSTATSSPSDGEPVETDEDEEETTCSRKGAWPIGFQTRETRQQSRGTDARLEHLPPRSQTGQTTGSSFRVEL